jgi:hypothetical protein
MTFKFDNSMLGDVAKCDACSVAKHVHGRQAKRSLDYGKFGNVEHAALKVYFDGKGKDATLAEFDRTYDSIVPPGEAPSDVVFERQNMRTITEQFCLTRPLEQFPFEVVETEKTVGVELAPGYEFYMKRDMLVKEKETGFFVPVDHKTRWGQINQWWLRKFRGSSQFSGYIWGNRQLTGGRGDKVYVNALSMSKLPDSNRKCKLHDKKFAECGHLHTDFRLLLFRRTEEQIEKWRQDALMLAKKAEVLFNAYSDIGLLKYVPRLGTFNEGCTFCEFAEWCEGGFDPDLMDELTVYDPWEPWKVEEGKGEVVEQIGPGDRFDYLWFYDKEKGLIFPSEKAISGLTMLPNPMALKKLWDMGRDAWMAVWNGYGKMAQVEMAEFAREKMGEGNAKG